LSEAMGVPGRPASDLVRELVAGLGQPTTLRAVGIKRENLDEIARRALSYHPVQVNPRPIKTTEDVKEILELAWCEPAPGGKDGPMSIDTLKAEIADGYGTPAVVIDLDRVERNIARVQQLCDAAGVANRPHIKTHKSPVLAKLQTAAGARGITCQKLGEAEVMVAAGLDDILISYNLLGAEKLGRLGRLLERANVTVAADNPTVIAGLPQAADIAGRQLGVVVECDTGRKRAGVETPGEAVALARAIKERPSLRFEGFLFYPTEHSWPQ